jgi:hypothetical protein
VVRNQTTGNLEKTTISGGEANTASNVNATLYPNYAGFYKTKSGVDLQLKSLSTPNDGGISITSLTNEVAIQDNAYMIKGQAQTSASSSITVNTLKDFSAITTDGTYIMSAEISGYTSSGSFTTSRKMSLRVSGGTPTLGTEYVDKPDEVIGTFSTPTISWDISSGHPVLTVTDGNSTTTYWSVTYQVSGRIVSL